MFKVIGVTYISFPVFVTFTQPENGHLPMTVVTPAKKHVALHTYVGDRETMRVLLLLLAFLLSKFFTGSASERHPITSCFIQFPQLSVGSLLSAPRKGISHAERCTITDPSQLTFVGNAHSDGHDDGRRDNSLGHATSEERLSFQIAANSGLYARPPSSWPSDSGRAQSP